MDFFGKLSDTFSYNVSCLHKLNKMSAWCGGRSVCFRFICENNKYISINTIIFFGREAMLCHRNIPVFFRNSASFQYPDRQNQCVPQNVGIFYQTTRRHFLKDSNFKLTVQILLRYMYLG